MAPTHVKVAKGRLIRDPVTHKPLPSIEDEAADPALVDLSDPHWYRRLQDGDIVVIEEGASLNQAVAEKPAAAVPEPEAAPPVEPLAAAVQADNHLVGKE